MTTSFPPFESEHELLRKTVREWVTRELYPHRKEWDDAGEWPAREMIKQLAGMGCLGIRYPVEDGGQGLDWWFHTAFVEELAHARNGGVVMSILVHTDISTPIISEIGTPEQKEEFLKPAMRGELIGSLGVTEPNCGSDVAAIETTARIDGGDYVINGAKTYITNGAFADFVVLAVRTGEQGHAGISLVLFPTKTKGFSVGKKLDKLGTRAVDSSLLHFDECRIPRRNLHRIRRRNPRRIRRRNPRRIATQCRLRAKQSQAHGPSGFHQTAGHDETVTAVVARPTDDQDRTR